MRPALLAAALLAPLVMTLVATAAPAIAAKPASDRAMARMLFVAPNGKPWRGQPGESYPSASWFAAVDANHDGKITRVEYLAEFTPYFDTLDTDHDGEIGPDEISNYERVILPEVQMSAGAFGGIASYAEAAGSSGNGSEGDGPPQLPLRIGGASFFGFFRAPEPILMMDTNFNRGITRAEFSTAAARTWRMVNSEGKPWLTIADLPKTQAQR